MTTIHGALLLIGSGPGIGTHTAALFAARGFSHILLLSRSASRLQTDAAAVRAAAPNATIDTIAADVSSASSLNAALAEVEARLTQSGISLETVFFNAARVGESKVLESPVEALEEDFRVRSQRHRPATPVVHLPVNSRSFRSPFQPSTSPLNGHCHASSPSAALRPIRTQPSTPHSSSQAASCTATRTHRS